MARISKEQLEKLQKNYKTDEAIGKLFGISRQAVHQLRTRYGIAPVRDKHKVRDNEILRYYREGLSCIKLARKFKISISQAYRITKKLSGQKEKEK